MIHKFGWSESQVGLGLAAVGISSAVVSGTLVGPLVKRLGEARAAYLGLGLAALSFFGYAFASEAWMVFPCIAVGAFMGLVSPSLRGIMSRSVHPDQQGELQGAISSLMGLTAIFSPLVMTQVFRIFSAQDAPLHFPGASFFLAGCLMLCALAIVAAAMRRSLAHRDGA
jgi:DHA1 family tetracycline resistance protein-like MFS transporter